MARTRSGGSGMKKPCDCCKRYLDHLDGKNQTMSYFLRRMTTKFKHSTIVPNRFLKHFAGKLPGTITLQSPNGSLYDVKAAERYHKVMLQQGWEAFLDAHGIQENDFLLFRHIEKSCFEVLILDSDGCEKVSPCTGIENNPSFDDQSVDSVDTSSNSGHETTQSSESERFTRHQKGSSIHRRKTANTTLTSSSSEESGEDIPSESESFESDGESFESGDIQTPGGVDYVLSFRSYLSEAQEEKVISLIQEIQPETTVFVAIMRKSHVQHPSAFLAIPKQYAFAHFPQEGMEVTLQMPGKSKKWHPRFYKRKDRSIYVLRGQWLDFVRDNHVKVGDICLLFPTKGWRKFTFAVHLLRATAAHLRGGAGFQSVCSRHATSSTTMALAAHVKEEPTDEGQVPSESGMLGVSRKYLENKDSGGPSKLPYIMSFRNCLSQSQKKIVEEKVQAIECEVPIFVAIMKKCNVKHHCELELSARYAAGNLPDQRQSVELHCNGETWETQMMIRNGTRWFLGGGWSRFVSDNGLRVRDICLFQLRKEEKLAMTVHIISREQF